MGEDVVRAVEVHLGNVFRELARQKESRVEEGDLMPDHVHMMLSIPPKYAVAGGGVDQESECDPPCTGIWREAKELGRAEFLGAGYFVSTVGRDEAVIRNYHQATEERGRQVGAARAVERVTVAVTQKVGAA